MLVVRFCRSLGNRLAGLDQINKFNQEWSCYVIRSVTVGADSSSRDRVSGQRADGKCSRSLLNWLLFTTNNDRRSIFAPAADNDEEYEMGPVGETHAVQWIGTAGVKGPKWARLPLLTVGMLGIQVSFAL